MATIWGPRTAVLGFSFGRRMAPSGPPRRRLTCRGDAYGGLLARVEEGTRNGFGGEGGAGIELDGMDEASGVGRGGAEPEEREATADAATSQMAWNAPSREVGASTLIEVSFDGANLSAVITEGLNGINLM